MKPNDECDSQFKVERAADELLCENGGQIDKVLGNHVALRLGMSKANQFVYEKLKAWREQRQAEGVGFIELAPKGLEEALKASLEPTMRKILRISLGMTGQTMAEERKAFEIEKAALRASLTQARDENSALQIQLEDSALATARLDEHNADLRSELANTKTDLVASQAREAELRSINAGIMARIGEQDPQPATIERLHSEASSKHDDQEYDFDMSRYDYDEERDG